MVGDADRDGRAADAAPLVLATPAHAGTHLTAPEAVTIATLAQRGYSVEQICELTERAPATVRRALTQSRELLTLLGPEAVFAWRTSLHEAAKRGFHQPAMHLLQAIKAIEPPTAAFNNTVQVAVNFALPGLPQPGTPQAPINVTPNKE